MLLLFYDIYNIKKNMTTLGPQKTGLHEISDNYVVNFDKENGLIMEKLYHL